MRVLWITNTIFPDASKALNLHIPVIGGWMHSGAISLLETNKGIELAVASLYNGNELKILFLNGITYFLIPDNNIRNEYNIELETHWQSVKKQFSPDIVHIHGTEYPHGLAFVRSCGNSNVVVSIQGLVSVYERYYFAGIKHSEIFKNITLRDLIRNDTLWQQKNEMIKRGKYEKDLIRSTLHIIGRTAWDKAHAWAINPNLSYHFCNETLRKEFYMHQWKIDACEKYSIFISQAQFPIKGLHQIIKALPVILRHFPDTKVYIAGNDFISNKGLRLSGFGKIISALMKKYNVSDKLIFTGTLTEKEMCDKYLRCHVFISPSSIENSSNSIGEAQLLGTPCVSSFVGGNSDLITDNQTGLIYRFEEIEMLAASVCKIFGDDNFAVKLSEQSKAAAAIRHDRQSNANKLSEIYQDMYSRI
jgi:glycosyltransferase involved in cell wall biosynthesis